MEGMSKSILYSFFHGVSLLFNVVCTFHSCVCPQESWDYIGSSRMAYDMSHDDAFPENEVTLPVSFIQGVVEFLTHSSASLTKYLTSSNLHIVCCEVVH